jgi:hypothetical protein
MVADKRRWRLIRILMLVIISIFVGLAGLASGRVSTNIRISGRVVDPTGASIQNAPVRLRLAAHGSAQQPADAACPTILTSATPGVTVLDFSGPDGRFSFRVEPGQAYELNIESPGFATIIRTIHVGTGQEFNAGDVVLSIAWGGEIEIENTLELRGIGGTKANFSMDDFAGLPRHTPKTTGDGTPITFQGVLLADALSKVAVPTGEVQVVTGSGGVSCHSTASSYEVLVQGKDGKQAVFPCAELDPKTDKAVYLVTKRDGKPLADEEGPFELIVPSERSRKVGLARGCAHDQTSGLNHQWATFGSSPPWT